MKESFKKGWDEQFGGILHFVNLDGEPLRFISDSTEPTVTLVKGGWGDKLWWVHSETLYASLLFYSLTGDEQYMRIHDKTLDYVRNHFINPDKETGEWIQILTREGIPQDTPSYLRASLKIIEKSPKKDFSCNLPWLS